MIEQQDVDEQDKLDKAKSLLDAFGTIEDTGHTSRSSGDARQAPMAAPKRETIRDAPSVGLARKTEGVMAHEPGVQSVRDAPINTEHKSIHEAPENISYAKAEEPAVSKTENTESIPLPKSVPLPDKKNKE